MEKSGAIDEQTTNGPQSGPNEQTAKLLKLLEDAQSPLYPGCEYTVLSLINEIMEIKAIPDSGMTDASIMDLLSILSRMLPKGAKLEQFIDKIDELMHAQSLMQDLKSHGGNAESSTQVLAAKSGKGKGKRALDTCTAPK